MNTEDLLIDTLHDRVERTDYPSTSLATVAARARSVRARRRRTTMLAAVAALAVVVPTAIWLGRAPGSSPAPSGPPKGLAPAIQAMLSLPESRRPALDYTAGHTYVAVGGSRLAMPPDAITAVPAQGGGLVVFTLTKRGGALFDSGTSGRLSLVDQGARTHVLGCGSQGFATSADRTQSAYWLMQGCHLTTGGTLHAGPVSTMGEAGQPGTRTPPGYVVGPVGFLGSSVVANRFPTDGGTSSHGVWVLGDGAPRLVPALTWASAVSEGGASGQLIAGNLTGGGSGVVDAQSGAVLWKAPPTWYVDGFSLDGRYVVARSTAGDGNGLRILDVRDGSVVTDVPAVAGTGVLGEAWGEDGSLMILVSGADASAIVRCTVAGELSRATPVAADHGQRTFYGFGTNP